MAYFFMQKIELKLLKIRSNFLSILSIFIIKLYLVRPLINHHEAFLIRLHDKLLLSDPKPAPSPPP